MYTLSHAQDSKAHVHIILKHARACELRLRIVHAYTHTHVRSMFKLWQLRNRSGRRQPDLGYAGQRACRHF
jgi:hypothetical protein